MEKRTPSPSLNRFLSTLLTTLLSTTLGGTGGGLGLLSLLSALGSGLLLLSLLDGLLAGGSTGLGALVAALLDHIERGTDDGTLGLHDTASALLGNFLFKLQNNRSAFASISRSFVVSSFPSLPTASPIFTCAGMKRPVFRRRIPLYFPLFSETTRNSQTNRDWAVLTSEIPFLCWRR
jgi:hypothetical protein